MDSMGIFDKFIKNKPQLTNIIDSGPEPLVINIEKATLENDNFRAALWTGKNAQVTLMSIGVGDDIGFETHPNLDQILCIVQGQGIVRMGESKEKLSYQKQVKENSLIIVPAGLWHNTINTGRRPIKLFSIYAPPQHPHGIIQKIKN